MDKPAATLRRVALLSGASELTAAHLRAALKQGMDDLGWHEGRNVEYRAAYANGNTDRLNALVGELIEQRAEVIVASSQQAVRAAQKGDEDDAHRHGRRLECLGRRACR